MNIGMLWFDNDAKTNLETKIKKAADYYRGKHGHAPNICFVHPSMPGSALYQGDIELRTTRSVMPNHFWIGVKQ